MKKFALLLFLTTLASCSGTKLLKSRPDVDCSAIFEGSEIPQKPQSAFEVKPICKVLPIQIHSGMKCEITGSDKINNLNALYILNRNDRAILVMPLNVLIGEDFASFKSHLVYQIIKLKVKKYLDSDVFASLQDYNYQGLNCEFDNQKLTAWIGDGKVIASFKETSGKK
jgi:hypothetical protein